MSVNDETASYLRAVAGREGRSVTEVVRRSVALLKHLQDAQDDGQQIRIEGHDSTVTNWRLL